MAMSISKPNVLPSKREGYDKMVRKDIGGDPLMMVKAQNEKRAKMEHMGYKPEKGNFNNAG